MCGIAGVLNLEPGRRVEEGTLRRMLAMIRHRGPDQFGIYLGGGVGLGNARLSIIDLQTGQQPIGNEDGRLWIVYNGEVFNFRELRSELESRGHRFSTQTDTEVILHLYEEYGPRALSRLNGQFAFAIWDVRKQELFLARDRLGIRPLFYATVGGVFSFASEIKALLADGRVPAVPDVLGLDQVFTFWSPISPRTVFQGIHSLPPGHYACVRNGMLEVTRYWDLPFQPASFRQGGRVNEAEYAETLRDLLIDSTRIRLRADVPVGAYLSGGLDSSVIAAIIRRYTGNPLDTFSLAFSDPQFDESEAQQRMARFLGTQHQVVYTTQADIGRVFPEVIWHAEVPLMRTAPAPMFLLSRRVRECGYKVVLTGEGADEMLGGYDLFKEMKVRRFWARQPASRWRPRLFQRLYPDIRRLSQTSPAFLTAFFGEGLTDTTAPDYSHAVRWRNNRRTRRFFSEDLQAQIQIAGRDGPSAVPYAPGFLHWDHLAQAQYLETTIFLSEYLLSSQGDRMAMANAVEGRLPFLDYRLVEFCCRLPASLKLRGLTEKYLLRQAARDWLPSEISQRPKRPYRAPVHRSFVNEQTPDYVAELLSPAGLARSGLFKAAAVHQLWRKVQQSQPVSETDDMALAGIISTQLWHGQFCQQLRPSSELDPHDDVKVVKQDVSWRATQP